MESQFAGRWMGRQRNCHHGQHVGGQRLNGRRFPARRRHPSGFWSSSGPKRRFGLRRMEQRHDEPVPNSTESRLDFWMPAILGHRSGRIAGHHGRLHAHRHGCASSSSNRPTAVGAVEMPSRVRRTPHFVDGQIGPVGLGQLGRLLAANSSHHAAHFLLANARPAPGFCHNLCLLSLLRRQSGGTARPARLQGKHRTTSTFLSLSVTLRSMWR